MKIFLSLLLAMSASGTLAFLAYLLLSFFADKYISAAFKYFLLKLCLLFFLFPFPLIKHLLCSFFLSTNISADSQGVLFIDVANTLILSDDGFSLKPFSENQAQLFAIWLSCLCAVALFQLYRYMHFRKIIGTCLGEDRMPPSLLSALSTSGTISEKVPLYYCDASISPFTCGIFHPAIVLTSLVSEDSAKLVIRHEMQHIKNHDIFFKILALLVILLHCFNPIVLFILFRELTEIQEMNCDEQLLKEFTPKEKVTYGNILIEISQKTQPSKAPAAYFSKTNKSFLKKRIARIASFPPGKSFRMYIVSAILCLAASVPVCAYSPDTLDVRDNPLFYNEFLPENVDWVTLEPYAPGENWQDSAMPADEALLASYDEILILEDGTVIPFPAAGISAYTAGCIHSYQSGTTKNHQKNGIGCVVDTYQIGYCTKCNYILTKTRISHTVYDLCPHS